MRQFPKFWGVVRAYLKRTDNEPGDHRLYKIACRRSAWCWFPKEDHFRRNRRDWKRYRRHQWRPRK